jgi:hypothetical protein
MRFCSFLRNLLLLPLIASPILVNAQFQPPASDELKMTADPKAPGASAVYLYREETTDDALHFHSIYERIKVLTEKGKELATIRIPYEHGADKVTDIQGRTIHADGTVIPLTAKPSDLMDVKTKTFQVNTVVFTLPSVEVGSILEYKLQIRYSDDTVSSPQWEIQQPYFVHKAHYLFKPEMTGGRYITNSRGDVLSQLMYGGLILDPNAKVARDVKGSYTLDLSDIPAAPDEDWMPPVNTLKWHINFYYTYAHTGPEFWESEGKRWSKSAEEFTKPGGPLKKAAADMLAPGDTDAQKAAKIYAAVMKLNNTDFSRKKSEAERKKEKLKDIHNAEDVWKQQGGSDDEIALLYVGLARAAGLKVWPMQVVNRNHAIFDSNYLSVSQLDDYIAIVQLDGKEVYLDPGQKMCPFGSMHWKHTLASGFRLSDKGAVMATTPSITYKESVVHRIANLKIEEDGGVKGTARLVMSGPEALHWRQKALENDEEEVKKQFNESIRDSFPEGVQADFDHFLALDDSSSNLIGIVNVTGSLGTMTGKHFFLPGLFFEARAKHPFVTQDKRVIPVDVHYPLGEQDEVTYDLPAGFNVESLPQPANTSWPDHALLKINAGAKDGAAKVVRLLAYNFTLLDPKEYSDLHDFYQKVAAADQQQLVLVRAPQAKGN